jgi:hypothetical protein
MASCLIILINASRLMLRNGISACKPIKTPISKCKGKPSLQEESSSHQGLEYIPEKKVQGEINELRVMKC